MATHPLHADSRVAESDRQHASQIIVVARPGLHCGKDWGFLATAAVIVTLARGGGEGEMDPVHQKRFYAISSSLTRPSPRGSKPFAYP